MPVGSFVTPTSNLRRGNEDNDASQLPILIKPVIDLMKGRKSNVGPPPPPPPPVVTKASDPSDYGAKRIMSFKNYHTKTEIPRTRTHQEIKGSATNPLWTYLTTQTQILTSRQTGNILSLIRRPITGLSDGMIVSADKDQILEVSFS